MREKETLVFLCTRAIASNILNGDLDIISLFDLPHELFDDLLTHLQPFALEKLHGSFDSLLQSLGYSKKNNNKGECSNNSRKRAKIDGSTSYCHEEISSVHAPNGGKQQRGVSFFQEETLRQRKTIFNKMWRLLFNSRWPNSIKRMNMDYSSNEAGDITHLRDQDNRDWQRIYWENHLQDCLDEVAATAVLPTFQGCVCDVKLSDAILRFIGFKGFKEDVSDCSKLSYHCHQFGCYVRYLKLQNVFCSPETCVLLRSSRLHGIMFRGVKSKAHVNGICKILDQNKDTLSSLEFMHSRLTMEVLNDVCGALYRENLGHHIMSLSIRYSTIVSSKRDVPTAFLTFISCGRSLCSLNISDSGLPPNFAKMILDTLIDSSSNISSLVLSENRISGWITPNTATHFPPFSSILTTPLRSPKILNLRGNNLGEEDLEYLKCTLMCMPQLQSLDVSDNPLEDGGARALVLCLREQSKKCSVVEIKLANCDLSSTGAIEILESLSVLTEPLKSLSIAQNNLGRSVALPLATLLSKGHIERLNIEGIGLGPCGFSELEQAISSDLGLVNLNISQNRGGLETAILLSKIIAHSPDLVVVDAGYNLVPLESVTVIHAALKLSRGKLKRLDLTGNLHLGNHSSIFDEFSYQGESIVVLSPPQTTVPPHDDDP